MLVKKYLQNIFSKELAGQNRLVRKTFSNKIIYDFKTNCSKIKAPEVMVRTLKCHFAYYEACLKDLRVMLRVEIHRRFVWLWCCCGGFVFFFPLYVARMTLFDKYF